MGKWDSSYVSKKQRELEHKRNKRLKEIDTMKRAAEKIGLRFNNVDDLEDWYFHTLLTK